MKEKIKLFKTDPAKRQLQCRFEHGAVCNCVAGRSFLEIKNTKHMKTIILTIIIILSWHYGYCQKECNIKKNKNIFIVRINPEKWISNWEKYVDKQNSGYACLKVLVPKDMKVKLKDIRHIYEANALYMDGRITHVGVKPRVVDKNGIGIYDIFVANDSLETMRCALYNGKQIILPPAPEIRNTRGHQLSMDIHQARLEVAEKFLEKHNNFTEEQKKQITKIFTDGFYRFPLHWR